MHFGEPEEEADVEYTDGGGDNDFALFLANCLSHGKTDDEAVSLWCERFPDRQEEAVVEDWMKDGIEVRIDG